MEILNQLTELLKNDVSIAIIILVIAIGEIGKRIFGTTKLNSFFLTLLVTLPISLVYWWIKGMPIAVWFLSYILAFWLYPLLIKPIMKILNIHYETKNDFVGDRPDDR